jgi:hypothetical protein
VACRVGGFVTIIQSLKSQWSDQRRTSVSQTVQLKAPACGLARRSRVVPKIIPQAEFGQW